jgi:hypothetical protein
MDDQHESPDEQEVHPSWLHNDNFSCYARSGQSRFYREWRGKQRPDRTLSSPSGRPWRYFTLRINFDMLDTWLRVCRQSHGASCDIRPTKELSRYTKHLVLIDLRRMCLVTLLCSTPYVALSYVWGKDFLERNPDSLLMNEQNLEHLKQPFALSRVYDKIPKTIQDAMKVAAHLGEKHLWVDCLCVAQNATSDKMDHMLKAMAYVYACAELTIVAAGGEHANHGLPGIPLLQQTDCQGDIQVDREAMSQPSRERSLQDVWKKPFGVLLGEGYPNESTWAKRGWTFQESLFARRLLIFDGVVSWICGRCFQSECCEDVGFPRSGRPIHWPTERPHLGVPMGLLSILPKLPSLGRWGMMVEDYSSRQWSKDTPDQTDIVKAFKGATEIMRSTFPDGILHGLPLFFFDIAMLWQSLSETFRQTKRRYSQPSWSWTGWKSQDCRWSRTQCLKSWYPHYAKVYRKSGEPSDWMTMAPLKPVAEYKLAVCSGQQPRFNGFYAYEEVHYRLSAPLPPGWTRYEEAGGHYYRYQETEQDDHRYTFPLPTVASNEVDLTIIEDPILLCTVPFLRGTFSDVSAHLPGSFFTLTRVRNRNKTARATFVLPTSALQAYSSSDARCLLVAISKADVIDHKRMRDWLGHQFVPPQEQGSAAAKNDTTLTGAQSPRKTHFRRPTCY